MIGHGDSWRRRLAAASLAAAVWGMAASGALGQELKGAISGRVVDEVGPAVAGATVTARNLATGFRQSAVADGSGGYRIEALPAGSYDVTAEASGFRTGLSTGVVVHASEFTNVAFALKAVAFVAQEPQGQAGAPPPDPMKQGPRMQIYGFAMTDLIYDIDQVNPDWFDVERPSKLPSFPNEFGDNGNFWASVRQTRFGVRGWLPTSMGEVKTEFEFDLFGVGVRRGPDDDPPEAGLGRARRLPHRPDEQRLHGRGRLPEHRRVLGARRDGLLPQRSAAMGADPGRHAPVHRARAARGHGRSGKVLRPHRAARASRGTSRTRTSRPSSGPAATGATSSSRGSSATSAGPTRWRTSSIFRTTPSAGASARAPSSSSGRPGTCASRPPTARASRTT